MAPSRLCHQMLFTKFVKRSLDCLDDTLSLAINPVFALSADRTAGVIAAALSGRGGGERLMSSIRSCIRVNTAGGGTTKRGTQYFGGAFTLSAAIHCLNADHARASTPRGACRRSGWTSSDRVRTSLSKVEAQTWSKTRLGIAGHHLNLTVVRAWNT